MYMSLFAYSQCETVMIIDSRQNGFIVCVDINVNHSVMREASSRYIHPSYYVCISCVIYAMPNKQ